MKIGASIASTPSVPDDDESGNVTICRTSCSRSKVDIGWVGKLQRRPGNREFNYTFQDLISWFHGRHSVKAGVIISPHFHADKAASADLFGTTTFTNRFTGYPYVDFLLGIPSTAARAWQISRPPAPARWRILSRCDSTLRKFL